MKRRILAMLLCLAMVLSLAACGTGSTGSTGSTGNASNTASTGSTADNNGKTGSVYWLNFKPESDEVLQDVAKMYKEKTGVDVKVVTAASGTYGQQQTAEMDKSNPPRSLWSPIRLTWISGAITRWT